jgi:large subunit ribosomal protein L25
MELTLLKAEKRELSTSSALKIMRKQGVIPAVYYGKTKTPVNLSVSKMDFRLVHNQEKRNVLLGLELDGVTIPAVVKEVQWDIISREAVHIDFIAVGEDAPVKVKVPVRLDGVATGVKNEGGMLLQTRKFVTLLCDANEIPTEILVDITECTANSTFYARQLPIGNSKLVTSTKSVIFTISKGRVAAT